MTDTTSQKPKAALKQAYVAATKKLAAIEKKRAALVAHTEDRFKAALNAQMDAHEALDAYIIGECENCPELILEGEKAHYDGEYYSCETCAPVAGHTLAELLAAGTDAYDWFEEGEPAYHKYVAYLKTLPADQSLATVQ